MSSLVRIFLALILVAAVSVPGLAQDQVASTSEPGFLLIEIDGLSEPRLAQAFDAGTMPFLQHLVESGSHVAGMWHTLASSTTPVSQAGILHGDSSAVIGYRWWDRSSGHLVQASDPDDARAMELAASGAGDLLADGGSSITNVVSGGAERSLLTVSRMTDTSLIADTLRHLLDPARATGFLVGLGDAVRDATGYRLHGEAAVIDPALKRKVALPIVGPALESALVDVSTMAVVREIERGVPILYASLLPYDEVAHYAGPDHEVAANALARIDDALRTIHAAAAAGPRPYHLVVLSDHGQTVGRPFAERYGATLEEVIRAGASQHLEPVVAASGNLAHIYLSMEGERLDQEAIDEREPGLIAYLAAHPGIGLVVVRTVDARLIAYGPEGSHELTRGAVQDVDPLAVYGPYAGASLRHMAMPETAGDLVIISTYDPVADEVLPFEPQASSHGGIGGPQTRAILVYPATLEPDGAPLALLGAEAVHAKVRQWLATARAEEALP